jgi:protein-lysine N-methyltransferase EEF2KMT
MASSDPHSSNKVWVTVVHCWSAPRSRSTALLYSFEARGPTSCAALDEPLYRQWLIDRGDAVARPYTSEMIAGVPPSEVPGTYSIDPAVCWKREVMSLEERIHAAAAHLAKTTQRSASKSEGEAGGAGGPPVIFCKHAKHCSLYNFERQCVAPDTAPYDLVHKHVLLIRDPVAVLSSWGVIGDVHGNSPTVDEVGIVPMLSIYSTVTSSPLSAASETTASPSSTNSSIVILDSDELFHDPEGTLANLCKDLHIAYLPSMMKWESGPHDCDGPWAPWWYHDVHQSTGWQVRDECDKTSKIRYRTLPPQLYAALEASYPAYTYLQSLTRGYAKRGPSPEELYEDPRNKALLVYVGASRTHGRLIPRNVVGISPWDSAVQGGDACWEGLRVYDGKILSLDAHLTRLFKSAKALGFDNVHTREQVEHAIFQTLGANGMRDEAHIRLTLTYVLCHGRNLCEFFVSRLIGVFGDFAAEEKSTRVP